jgi:hypothetical protein
MANTNFTSALPLTLLAVGFAAACSSSSASATKEDAAIVFPDAAGSGSGSGSGSGTALVDAGIDAAPVDAGIPYPAGPYGITVGSTIDPSLTWQGYLVGATSPTTIKITDYYDPDGSKGINALVLDTSAQWCIACQGEAAQIPGWVSSTAPNAGNWNGLGVRVLTLVVQTNANEPASIQTALQWRTQYSLASVLDVVADPNASFTTNVFPLNLLVDPRTMKITVDLDNDQYNTTVAGHPTLQAPDPAIASLATKNQTTH